MNKSECLQKTHFYVSNEYVSVKAQDGNNNLSFPAGPNFSFDVIEQPFHCVIASGEGTVEVKLYVRSEVGAFLENPDIAIKLFEEPQEDAKQFKITANTGIIGDGGLVIGVFLKIAKGICAFAEEKELVTELSNIDTESEGFVIKIDDDKLLFNKVSGRERPDMACTTLFGGVQMMRPYHDEIMDKWTGEMMSIEEKTELAEDGDEEMMEQLAMTYLNGDDEVDVDPEKAVYWFTRLAKLNNASAQFNLGLLCAKGFGVERNFETAINWLKKAGENGDDDVPVLIEKFQKAITAEKILATGDDAQAQADLADVYMSIGNSLDIFNPSADYAIALEYAQKSAAQNNGDGVWALALAYEHGRGVDEDIDKAIELYRRGAELGHAPSQHSLACYYFRGDVIEEDHEKAFILCMKSAEQGYGLAMRDVGRCYQFGNGVDDDMTLAIEWYEKALEIIDDPELEQKVVLFKMLEDDGLFKDDFDEEDEMPTGMMEDLELKNDIFDISDDVLTRYNGQDSYVEIPYGVKQIGDGASMSFFMAPAKEIVVPNTVVMIAEYAFFRCDDLEKITLPQSISTIASYAFRECSSLNNIEFPDNIMVINRETCWGCVNLKSIKFPTNLKVIEEKAFSGCIAISSIELPEGLERIEDGAFWGDENLEAITIPESVSYIGEMAFCDCEKLTVKGKKGSLAENYAKINKIPFIAV